MKRTIHFVSGLPRSGSTLLCNLLAQNPRFHATSTSGILDVMLLVRRHWRMIPELHTPSMQEVKIRVVRQILDHYHDEPDNKKPVIFDKSRGWLGHLDMAEAVLGRKVKVLVCVRDVRDCVASFERLWRRHTSTRQYSQEAGNFLKWQTLEGRCAVWMGPNQVVGSAYNNVRESLRKGYKDRMHFVEFEKLSANPKETMQQVYEFLDEKYFNHDFDHVEQVTHEDDEQHGIPELHIIRPKIEPVESHWKKVLGSVGDRFAALNDLWLKLDGNLPVAGAPPSDPALVVLPEPPIRRRRPQPAGARTQTSTSAQPRGPQVRGPQGRGLQARGGQPRGPQTAGPGGQQPTPSRS